MLAGKKHGQGNLYHENGIVEYKGQFVDDLAHTNHGKLYNNEGSLQYEGPMHMGKKHGFGKLYHPNHALAYKGYFLNGLYDTASNAVGLVSYGSLYDTDGFLYYMGGLKQGVLHGPGQSFDKESGKIKYHGQFKDGIENDPENGIFYYLNEKSNIKYIGGKFIFLKLN